MLTNLHFELPDLENEIRTSFSEGRRLLIYGGYCAGRSLAIHSALAGINIIEWDLENITRVEDVDAIAEKAGAPDFPMNISGGVTGALAILETLAETKPVALVIKNLDSFANCEDGFGLIGWFRGELQMVQNLRVFYTASDAKFVATHVGGPYGAFYKQMVLVKVPPVTPEAAKSAIESWCGREMSHEVLTELMSISRGQITALRSIVAVSNWERGEDRGWRSIGVDDVRVAVTRLTEVLAPVYARILHNNCSAEQRSVLRVIASVPPVENVNYIAQATGIARENVGRILSELEEKCFYEDEGTWPVLSDPILALYLRKSGSELEAAVAV